MRKIFLAVLLVTVWASLCSAGEIVYNLGADPRTIDPALNNALDGANVIMNIFEGLVRLGFDDKPEPACAESWEISDDGMTWTFHLRENLKWSDGEPLTAPQFRDGFLRALNPETGSPYAYYAFFIKNGEAFYNSKASADDVGLSAPDDRTLIIQLEYKNPLMLDYLAFALFQPARMDIISENPRAWAARPETLISNGAFKLESWRHGDGGEIILVKNPNYWDAENVKVDRLRFVLINDENTSYAAFKAGRIDYMGNIPSQLLPMLLQRGEAQSLPALGTGYCDFNVTRPPFDDPRVRRAFTLAIDRRIIVEKVTRGGQKPATGFVCDAVPGTTDEQDFRDEGGSFLPERADVEEARRLLAEAGYPNGEGFPHVSYKYNSNAGNKQMAEALQGMWKQVLGVEVELINEEWKVFIETRNRMDYDIARDAWIMDFFDAGSILELCISGSAQNNTGYSNPRFDEAMRKAAVETDRVKRINFMHEAEAVLMEDLPVAPIYFYTSAVLQSKRVKGIHRSPLGYVLFRGAETVQ
ncbi:MAG: peptide ABC transporter substrate-binding protein [Synergistaceae bacterium]|nr:peptide ABC transporter substrate-binding protein [Synergistaceae bacterium]